MALSSAGNERALPQWRNALIWFSDQHLMIDGWVVPFMDIEFRLIHGGLVDRTLSPQHQSMVLSRPIPPRRQYVVGCCKPVGRGERNCWSADKPHSVSQRIRVRTQGFNIRKSAVSVYRFECCDTRWLRSCMHPQQKLCYIITDSTSWSSLISKIGSNQSPRGREKSPDFGLVTIPCSTCQRNRY